MTYAEEMYSCCGILEIDDLGHSPTPEEAMRALKATLQITSKPFVVFTAVTRRRIADHCSSRHDNYGQAFADFIEKNNLGSVIHPRPRANPGTDNQICIWVWTPDWPAVRAYYGNQ